VEPILALKPDLVITHNYDGDQRRISRLREAGIMVFDCGPMLGWSTLEPNLRSLGALLMMPERASREITHLQRRLSAVAAGLEPGDRRRGIYVAVYGGRLYGGARGTSFHDVLTFAGLVDVAAEAGLSGWPQYDPEQLLTLDPPIVITRPGMAEALRKVPGLDRLGALASPQTAIEIDGALLEDPGYGMLPAAEAIHHAVYR
jgi:iron complex transport system substrate-binding protein